MNQDNIDIQEVLQEKEQKKALSAPDRRSCGGSGQRL